MAEFFNSWLQFFTQFINFSIIFEIVMVSFGAVAGSGLFKRDWPHFLHDAIAFIAIFAASFLFTSIGSAVGSFASLENRAIFIIFFMLLPGAVYLLFLSKGLLWHRLLRTILFISCCYVVTEIGHHFNMLLGPAPSVGFSRQLLMSLPYLLIAPSSIWICIKKIHHVAEAEFSLLFLTILVFASTLAIAFMSGRYQTEDVFFHSFMIVALILLHLINLITYYAHYQVNKHTRRILELQSEAQLNSAALLMLRLNNESIERTTRARHDLKNTLSYLRDAVSRGQIEEAISFLNQSIDQAFGQMPIVDCGNPIVSSLMNLELRKAAVEGVEVKYKLVVPPTLPLSELDICSLMTNIIDNAISGCKAAEIASGYVDFQMVTTNSFLRITCKNPTFLTTIPFRVKKPGDVHGYGMNIIRNIAAEHNGFADFHIESGSFIVEIMMDLGLGGEQSC